jgi:hypothetical protein
MLYPSDESARHLTDPTTKKDVWRHCETLTLGKENMVFMVRNMLLSLCTELFEKALMTIISAPGSRQYS